MLCGVVSCNVIYCDVMWFVVFEVHVLWLQRELKEGRVKVFKMLGTQNPSDVFTKPFKSVIHGK